MKQRVIPSPLYETVLQLAELIAQHGAGADFDEAVEHDARERLVELFEERQAAGSSDPFLTEAMADFTEDDDEAVGLYRLAIEQCSQFPGEPTHTKKQGIVERLIYLGRISDARKELVDATQAAFAAGDTAAIEELNELAKNLAG